MVLGHKNTTALAAILIGSACVSPSRSDDPLPGHVVARVNGESVGLDGFRDWLVDRHGWSHLEDYLSVVLLRQRARELGVAVSVEELEAALDRDDRDHLWLRYSGNEEAFEADLATAGMDRVSRRLRERERVEREELARRIVRREREPTDAALRELYRVEYPEDVRRHVQLAWFDRMAGAPRTLSGSELQERLKRARERARQFHAAVADDPASFSHRVRTESDFLRVSRGDGFVRDLRESGGELPSLPDDPLLVSLSAALAEVDLIAGELLDPIDLAQGTFIVRVVGVSDVTFEDVEYELLALFHERAVTPQEIYLLLERLRADAEIVKNPAFRTGAAR